MLVLAVLVATIAAFVLSSTFYTVAAATSSSGRRDVRPAARPAPWQIVVEVLRSAAVATLVAGLLAAGGWQEPGPGALLGLALWTLPAVLLTGSVVWEEAAARGALLHAGDWLLKLVTVGLIVGWLA